MARALRIQFPGAHYHVTCRGNERREIFRDGHDEELFVERLASSVEIYGAWLLAYVLMGNHFHLLVSTPEGNLSELMRHFNISYTSAFNRRHGRSGHLYQGRYKAFLIDADSYLLEVSRYIHLNPVRVKGVRERSVDEKWDILIRHTGSSLPGYLCVRPRSELVRHGAILSQTGGDTPEGRERYGEFIRGGMSGQAANPLDLARGRGIVGEDEFVRRVKQMHLDGERKDREQPTLRRLRRELDPEELIGRFELMTGIERKELCRRGGHSLERSMLMELLHRFCGISQPEIGRLLGGIDYSTVSRARKQMREHFEKESKSREEFEGLLNELLKMSSVKI